MGVVRFPVFDCFRFWDADRPTGNDSYPYLVGSGEHFVNVFRNRNLVGQETSSRLIRCASRVSAAPKASGANDERSALPFKSCTCARSEALTCQMPKPTQE